MTEIPNAGSAEQGERKEYDVEERTFQFARKVALYCKELPRSVSNAEYTRQVIKASASVGANYLPR
jgi:hypothetical protein